MKHLEDCVARTKKYEMAIAEFEERWPDYCRDCGAIGAVHYTENMSPHGSGRYWPMEMQDVCESCLGSCPRCAHEFGEDEHMAFVEEMMDCPKCGWQWGENQGDEAPYPPVCLCYLSRDIRM